MSPGAAVRIGSVAGIPLRVHVSWLIALFLVTSSLSVHLGPSAGALAPFVALLTALALFSSLVAHELGHSLVARRRGVAVRSITLFVFGGVASLESEPKRPRDELAIAIAGPLVSVAIGIAGLALAASAVLPPILSEPIAWIGRVNVGIAVFNMLPGFPLDGGRILRGVLWMWRGDQIRATFGAARAGRGIAYGLMALGVLRALTGTFVDGFWVVFIGWFLLSAARSAAADAMLRASLGDEPIVRAVVPDYPSVPSVLNVLGYVHWVTAGAGQRTHVVRDGAEIAGVVTIERALAVPRALWAHTTIGQIALEAGAVPTFDARAPIVDVLGRMGDAPLAFVRENDAVVGVVDRERLDAIVRTRLELGAVGALVDEGGERWVTRRAQPG